MNDYWFNLVQIQFSHKTPTSLEDRCIVRRWQDERKSGSWRRPLEHRTVGDRGGEGALFNGQPLPPLGMAICIAGPYRHTHTFGLDEMGHSLSEVVIRRCGRLENDLVKMAGHGPGTDVLQLGGQCKRIAVIAHKSLIRHTVHRPRYEGRNTPHKQSVGCSLYDGIAVLPTVIDRVVMAYLNRCEVLILEEGRRRDIGSAGWDKDLMQVGRIERMSPYFHQLVRHVDFGE